MKVNEELTRMAIAGYRVQIAEAEKAIAELEGKTSLSTKHRRSKQRPAISKRKISAAGKAKIALAQKKRWAAFHKAQKKAA